MARIVPADHIYINTNEEYVEFGEGAVAQRYPAEHILSEPIHRNTAPSMAWAEHRIARCMNPKACVVATPSDQAVFNEEAFCKDILEGLALS